MKTIFTSKTIIRASSIILGTLLFTSCGAFYPYAYYYNSGRATNGYSYSNSEQYREQAKNYGAYFEDKANEYNEVLGEEIVTTQQDSNTSSSNNQVNVQLVIDSNPYNTYYSWGFRPYWDPYFAYSPYVNYGYYSPFFYDQWNWRYTASFYNWGFNSWWYPYHGFTQFYYPYNYTNYTNYPSYNRGRSNQNRSAYRSSRILGYNSSRTLASSNRGTSNTIRSYTNTNRSNLNSSLRTIGNSNNNNLRSSNYSRLKSYLPKRASSDMNRSIPENRSYSRSYRNTNEYRPKQPTTIKRSSSSSSSYYRSITPSQSSTIQPSRSTYVRPSSIQRGSASRSSSPIRSSSSSSSPRKRN